MANFPKVVALDTDWTIFWGFLDADRWGKGPNASPRVEDNVQYKDFWEVYDRSNPSIKCGMFADVPEIIGDILKNGAKLAIVTRNRSQALCDRVLWYWKANDGTGTYKPILELTSYYEVYDTDKVEHFKKIRSYYHQANFTDMILFDDEATNNTVEMMIGVTFQVSRDQKGLTWDNYRTGIDMWRRNQSIITPFLGLNLACYPRHKFIGYSGMDINTTKLLESGLRRNDREEAARWGFAVYVADNPAIAKYFAGWIKPFFQGQPNNSAQTIVCKIYVRDGDIWNRINKIWVPDDINIQTNVKSTPFHVGWSQEDRDRLVASWGVQKPYVLFARHPNMDNWKQPYAPSTFPVPKPKRWNEMAIYPQIQEAQLLVIRMTDYEVATEIRNGNHLHYEKKRGAWNITMTPETLGDIYKHGEQYEFQP
ncbi:hypothetical protein ONZ45_g7603 [Pleurotus djamor]|nr:hypothetical protein ONZ45_g7603 [Pleurotus djamor]